MQPYSLIWSNGNYGNTRLCTNLDLVIHINNR